ncbi:MAG: DUF2142 domain-containing protein [Chitinophagales bacterium]
MKNFFWNKIPLEYYFLIIGLFFGMKLVFINPPWQTNDEDRHFYNSWNYAHGFLTPSIQGNKVGNPMPVKIFEQVQSFQGIRFNEQSKINHQTISDDKEIIYEKSDTFFYNNPNYNINPVGYLPAILGIKLGELFKQNPITVHWWARTFGLFAFLLIVFYAIRIIPVYKNVMMLVALAPMSLYQAASVTYDTLCIASSFLLFAFIVKWLFQKEKISRKDLILFFLAFVIQIFSKPGYYFIPFLLLMIPPDKFSFSFPKIKLTVMVLAVIMLPSITWGMYIKSFHFPAGKPFQNDFLFNTSQNLSFHLKNIPGMISDLLRNILVQGKEWIKGCVGRFGYSYTPLPGSWIFMYALALFGMASVDHDAGFKLNVRQRVISAVLLVASLGALIAGFYIMGSPVGARFIFGFQGRYFIPVLPLVLFQLYGTIPNNLKKFLPLITILISILMLYKTVGFIEETFYFAT